MADKEEESIKVKSATITVSYELNQGGRGENDFNSLQDLKKWLDAHPLIADKLGYAKKKK